MRRNVAKPRKFGKEQDLTPKSHAYGIQNNIAGHFQQVSVAVDEHRLVATLKQVSHTTVPAIEGLRVDPVHFAHAARQGGAQRFDQQVIVVIHQAPSPHAPLLSPADLSEPVEEGDAIFVIEENRLAGIAARHHMMDRAGEFDA